MRAPDNTLAATDATRASSLAASRWPDDRVSELDPTLTTIVCACATDRRTCA